MSACFILHKKNKKEIEREVLTWFTSKSSKAGGQRDHERDRGSEVVIRSEEREARRGRGQILRLKCARARERARKLMNALKLKLKKEKEKPGGCAPPASQPPATHDTRRRPHPLSALCALCLTLTASPRTPLLFSRYTHYTPPYLEKTRD